MAYLSGFMSVKKYVSDYASCVQNIIGGTEIWDIAIGTARMQTEYAAYALETDYRRQKAEYLNHFKSLNPSIIQLPPFDETYAYDFIDDLRAKKEKSIGGIVVFFIESRGKYYLRHTKPVKSIKTLER